MSNKTTPPKCDIMMVYSKNIDLWAIDMTLNSMLEKLLNRFALRNETAEYTTLDKVVHKRFKFSSNFVGSFGSKTQIEQSVLESLYDTKAFGSGKRRILTTDYQTGLKKIGYMKTLFSKLANAEPTMNRKVVASIFIGDADA